MTKKANKSVKYEVRDCTYLNKQVAIKKDYIRPIDSDTHKLDRVSCSLDFNCKKSNCQMIGGNQDYIGVIYLEQIDPDVKLFRYPETV